jgi:hypothetical protein
MTPLDLQKAIVAEATSLFQGKQFFQPRKKTTDPKVLVPLSIYSQALPMKEGYAFSKYVPYLTVQLKNAKQEEETEPNEVTLFLNLCIFDDDESNQGHEITVDMIEKMRQDFFKKRIIGGKYSIKLPFEYELNDQEIYPYYVAVAETHWNLPLILPEDENL